MKNKKEKIYLYIFTIFFLLTGTHSVMQKGFILGAYQTILIWSFFVLCLPIPRTGIVTSKIIRLITGKRIKSTGTAVWSCALAFNLITYASMPHMYLGSLTTFLLYRILYTPWPFWLILILSISVGLYNSFFVRIPEYKNFFRHRVARTVLFSLSIITFGYLSFIEIVVFLYSKTCG